MTAHQPAPTISPLRRRLGIIVACTLLLVILAWLLLAWTSFQSRFARLTLGLTKIQVEQLLGPPGDYCSPEAWHNGTFVIVGPVFPDLRFVRQVDVWRTDYGDYYTGYDANYKLITTRIDPCRRPPTFFERLSNWWDKLTTKKLPAATMTTAPSAPPSGLR